MKTNLISIGNSRGVRIPKPFIEQCGLSDEIEMEVKEGSIVIHSIHKVRKNWDKAFGEMAKAGDDKLLNSFHVTPSWDEKDWEWK
ncbi:MAG: AbrB/MazE/SpoVT family DNA-binding domain-containing protein [Verrucomicrobiota bacterium]